MRKAKVVNGEYKGRGGEATEVNEVGNVMFYPEEGIHPYRVCLNIRDIKFLDGDKNGINN